MLVEVAIGEVVDKIVGAVPKNTIASKIDNQL